ncbi:transient receptor potential cation channel subfamily M member-like 2 [Dreissena polymorpha]|nr:transient receptor potential cation channel subfamily M member-like 2 [Dreissena polymorpha]
MYQANLYPNSPSSKPFFWDKFWHTAFWQIFGELFLDEIGRGPPTVNCTTDESVWRPQGGTDRCPTDTHMVGFLGGIYMILTNILLNNLLIAMLSHTFANVQEKSGHIWKFYCYGIVREYYSRPVLFPPWIILFYIRRTIRYVVSRGDTYDVYDSEFRLKDTEGFYSKHLLKFADAAAKRCLKQNKNAKTQEF